MGLIVGYKDLIGQSRYFIRFDIDGKEIGTLSDRLSDANLVLGIARKLESSGITPVIRRQISYADGNYIESQETKNLTVSELERTIREEEIPKKRVPIIENTYLGDDDY